MTHRSLISKASSLFLVFGLTLTSLGGTTLYADDIALGDGELNISVEEGSPAPEEMVEDYAAEPVEYTVTLPYTEGYRYEYDDTHSQAESGENDEDISIENEDEDILLSYGELEEVEFSIKAEEGYTPVDHIKLYDPDDAQKIAIPYREIEDGKYIFTMPASDVYVDVTPGEKETVPETTPPQEEVAPEVQEDSVTVETSATPAATPETPAEAPAPEQALPGETQPETTTAPVAEDSNSQQTTYIAETDTDGTPTQGSIEQVADYTVALNDESFDAKSDFTNINVDSETQTIAYVSDDVMISVEGRYSSIYRVDTASGKFWFVLRPVIVSASVSPAAPAVEAADENPDETIVTEEAATEAEETAETPAQAQTQESAAAEEIPEGIQMNPETESAELSDGDTLAQYTASYTVNLQSDKANGDAPLTGAIVTFMDPDSGEEVGSANSNEDAQVVFNSQEEDPSHRLTAVLTTPPAGYVMNDTEYTVKKDGSTTMLLTGITGTIQIITEKKDGAYPERTFVLKKSTGDADDVTVKTNDKGVATTDDTLPYGNWNIYENDQLVATTIISEYNGVSLVHVGVDGKSTSKQVSVTITDKDNNVITGDTVAIFKIFRADDTEFANQIKLYKINGEGTETSRYDQFKMDADGSIQMAGNLENGDYVLKETTAPAGYKLNDKPVAFTVKDNVVAYSITIAHVKAVQEEEPTPDKDAKHTLSVNNTVADSDGKKLSGVTYELYEEDGKKKVGEAVSGDDGIAAFADVPDGKYILKETAVPEFYAATLAEEGEKLSLIGADLTIDCEHHLSAFTLVRLYREKEDSAKTTKVSGVKYLVAPATEENTESVALASQIAEIRSAEKTNLETLNALEDGAVKEDLLSTYGQSSANAMREQLAEAATAHGYSDVTSAGDTYKTNEEGSFLVMYNGSDAHTGLLHGTKYTVTEIDISEASVPALQPDTTVHEITVDERGLVSAASGEKGYACTLKVITGKAAQTLATAEITAYRTDGETALAGVKFVLKDKDGNTVDEWTSKEKAHSVVNLEEGTYELTEAEAPENYVAIDPIKIKISEEDYGSVKTISAVHEKVFHEVSLIDGDTKKPITGASITVTDESGSEVDTWETTEEPHRLEITPAVKKSDGTYSPVFFIEADAVKLPEGYASNTSQISIYSQENGTVSGTTIKAYKIAARAYVMDDEGNHIAGAKMKVLDESGKTVESWTSDGKSFYEMYLPIGSYTLQEEEAPDYFLKGNDMKFTIKDTKSYQTVTMVNKYITVTFSKVDAETKKELSGAVLTVKDENGNTATDINGKELTWTTDGKPHTAVMKAGKYIVVEESAPAGYTKAADVEFSIDNITEKQAVTVTDTKIFISIYKLDAVTNKPLSGAALVLKDSSGNTIDSWTTDGTEHKVTLPAGAYRLTETTAPAGYELSKDVDITVTDTSDAQNFYMYDYPKDTTVNLTGKTRTKSKVVKAATPATYSAPAATADGKGGSNVTSSPSRTGDFNRYINALALIVLGMGLACLFFIWRGRANDAQKMKEEGKDEDKE